jgi:CheY-like chemotaxis protein
LCFCSAQRAKEGALLSVYSLLQGNLLFAPGQRRFERVHEILNAEKPLGGHSFEGPSEALVKSRMTVTQILVVDDYLPWHAFVFEVFEPETDLKIIATAVDGFEAVRKAKELRPDLILMDASLPGMNGFEATRIIRAASARSKILFLSEHRGAHVIQGAFDAGSSGYVLKSDSNSDLIRGVRTVLLGKQFVSHSLTEWRRGLDPID